MGKMSQGEKLTRALSLNPLPSPPYPHIPGPPCSGPGRPESTLTGHCQLPACGCQKPLQNGEEAESCEKEVETAARLAHCSQLGTADLPVGSCQFPPLPPLPPTSTHHPQLLPFPSCASPPLATSGCLSFLCFSLKPLIFFFFL